MLTYLVTITEYDPRRGYKLNRTETYRVPIRHGFDTPELRMQVSNVVASKARFSGPGGIGIELEGDNLWVEMEEAA
jgi:hypothetical protein